MIEWPTVSLKAVVDLQVGFPFKSKEYSADPSDIRLLRGDNVVQGGLRWNGAPRWPVGDAQRFANYALAKGDVVLAMDRPWIEAGLKWARINDADVPALLVQRVARLRGTRDVDQRFLSYIVASPAFTAYLRGVQTGTAVPHISATQILSYKFRMPLLAEQRSMAELIGSLDDKIELNRRMAIGMLQLGIAVFTNAPTQEQAMSSLCRITRSIVRPMDSPNQTYAHFSLPSFDRGSGPAIELGQSILSHKLLVTDGSILLSRLNPEIQRVWLTDVDPDYPAIASTEWFVVAPGGPWRHAMFVALNRPHFLEAFASLATGTTGSHQRVSAKDFLAMQILWPEVNRLDELESKLKLLFDLTASLNRQNRTLAQLRDLLLPRLMSGQIRINEAEKAVAEAG